MQKVKGQKNIIKYDSCALSVCRFPKLTWLQKFSPKRLSEVTGGSEK